MKVAVLVIVATKVYILVWIGIQNFSIAKFVDVVNLC